MPQNPLVECLICHEMKKALGAHLRSKHNLSTDEYKEWAKANGHGEVDLGWTLAKAGIQRGGDPKAMQAQARAYHVRVQDPVTEQFETLSEAEKQNFKKRFDILFHQADYDPALEPGVKQIVMNEMVVERYQAYINAHTLKIKPGDSLANKNLDTAHRVIKQLIDQNLAQMSSMGLTREKKLAQKKHVETTPSRLITAYAQELQRLTPEERKRLQEDEDDAVRRFIHNQAALLELVPASATEDDDEDI